MQIISFGKIVQTAAGTPIRFGYGALAANLNPIATALTVTALTAKGFCQDMCPFTLDLDLANSSYERVTVTAVAGATFTIVRGQNGTLPTSHLSGAVVSTPLLIEGIFAATMYTNSSYMYWGKYTLNVSSGAGIMKELFPKSSTGYDDIYDLSLTGSNQLKMSDFAFDANVSNDG